VSDYVLNSNISAAVGDATNFSHKRKVLRLISEGRIVVSVGGRVFVARNAYRLLRGTVSSTFGCFSAAGESAPPTPEIYHTTGRSEVMKKVFVAAQEGPLKVSEILLEIPGLYTHELGALILIELRLPPARTHRGKSLVKGKLEFLAGRTLD
jgi:hypothetical protein